MVEKPEEICNKTNLVSLDAENQAEDKGKMPISVIRRKRFDKNLDKEKNQ